MDNEAISTQRAEIRGVLLSASAVSQQLDYHKQVFEEDGLLKTGLDRRMVEILASLALAREIPAIFVSELTASLSVAGAVDAIAVRYLVLLTDRQDEVVVSILPQ